MSIEESLRERFRINVGDTMRFDVMGRMIEARVTSVRHVDWADSRAGGFMFVFRPGVLETAPHGFISLLPRSRRTPRRARRLQARPGRRVPERVGDRRPRDARHDRSGDRQRHARGHGRRQRWSLLSGLLILIGAVAMTKFRRIYEAAIFKTLGATRAH